MAGSIFYFDQFKFEKNTGEICFSYHVENGLEFTEKIVFPGAPFELNETVEQALNQVLFLAHIAVGISYYKAFLPEEIKVLSGALTKEQAQFFDDFYLKGLGEFAIKNDVNLQGKIHFPFEEKETEAFLFPLMPKALVPVGGGKDSCVVMELLKELNIPATGVACGGSKSQSACAEKSGLPYLTFERTIDPKLIELNNAGKVYNGHIPITGVLAFLLWALALLRGEKYVVMACEKSANSGNMKQGDLTINHQWSKSFEFEKMFYDLTQNITPDFRYFSILRPISEAHIARLFAQKCSAYFNVFTSCNKAFKLDLNKRLDRWCGACDKCRFVFLILAPFMNKETLIRAVGTNPLNDENQMEGYRELLGLSGHKPFECVGEVDECRWAFNRLKQDVCWQEDAVVKALEVPPAAAPFDVSDEHLIPEELQDVMARFRA
ncbi:MAG: endonuclease domain-containing protein [Alphaproteobacteria bacterium]|nr:endonuclease domain-containing protein [Alphaproteobacteria bacterium]